MYDAEYHIVLSGPRFSPTRAAAETGIVFVNANEPTDIVARGPRRGHPRGCGSASIAADDRLEEVASISDLLDRVEPWIGVLRNLGAEEMRFDAAICYRTQCNLTYEPEHLERIGRMGLVFWISCYEFSDEDDE